MNILLKINLSSDWNNTKLEQITGSVEPYYGTDRSGELFDLDTTPYKPSKNDRLYFMPNVNIPRIKLKNLFTEYNIKVTRDAASATHVFAGKNTYGKICKTEWAYKIPVTLIKEFINDYSSYMDEKDVEDIRQALEFYNLDYVVSNCDTKILFKDNDLPNYKLDKHPDYKDISVNSRIFYTVDSDNQELMQDIKDKTIYDESCILDILNGEDASVIDKTMFEQIDNLFKSSDTDNHILAMEIMANTNYKLSLLYLGILFKEHNSQIFNLPTRNHVNFKSLLTYMNITRYTTVDKDFIVRKLIEKNVLDVDKLNVLMDKYADEIEYSGNSNFFKVKTVTVSPEILSIVNNYTYSITPEESVVEDTEELFTEEDNIEVSETEPEFAAEDNIDVYEEELPTEVAPVEDVIEELPESEPEPVNTITEEVNTVNESFDDIETINQPNPKTNDNDNEFDWF